MCATNHAEYANYVQHTHAHAHTHHPAQPGVSHDAGGFTMPTKDGGSIVRSKQVVIKPHWCNGAHKDGITTVVAIPTDLNSVVLHA